MPRMTAGPGWAQMAALTQGAVLVLLWSAMVLVYGDEVFDAASQSSICDDCGASMQSTGAAMGRRLARSRRDARMVFTLRGVTGGSSIDNDRVPSPDRTRQRSCRHGTLLGSDLPRVRSRGTARDAHGRVRVLSRVRPMPCAFTTQSRRLLRLLLLRVGSVPTGPGWKWRVLSPAAFRDQ